jgi:hypothetical protein
VAAPLIRLSDEYALEVPAAWVVYIGDDEPRHVPAPVRAMGRYVQHVMVCGPFGVQFWYRVSDNGEKWYWAAQTG